MWLVQVSNVVHPVTSMCCTLYMPATTAVGSPAAHDTCCMAVRKRILCGGDWRGRDGKQPGPDRRQAVISVDDVLQVGPRLIPVVGVVVWCSQVLVLVLHHLSIHGAEPACGVRSWGLCSMLASRYCKQPSVNPIS